MHARNPRSKAMDVNASGNDNRESYYCDNQFHNRDRYLLFDTHCLFNSKVYFRAPTKNQYSKLSCSIIQLEREIDERKSAQRLLQTQYERHVLLSKVTRKISKSLKASEIFDATASRLAHTYNVSACSVHLYYTEDTDDDRRPFPSVSPRTLTTNKKLRKMKKKANMRFEDRMVEFEEFYKDRDDGDDADNDTNNKKEETETWGKRGDGEEAKTFIGNPNNTIDEGEGRTVWNVEEDVCEQENRLHQFLNLRTQRRNSLKEESLGRRDLTGDNSSHSSSFSSLPAYEHQYVTALLAEHLIHEGLKSCQDKDLPFNVVEDLAHSEVAVAVDVEAGTYVFHDGMYFYFFFVCLFFERLPPCFQWMELTRRQRTPWIHFL